MHQVVSQRDGDQRKVRGQREYWEEHQEYSQWMHLWWRVRNVEELLVIP